MFLLGTSVLCENFKTTLPSWNIMLAIKGTTNQQNPHCGNYEPVDFPCGNNNNNYIWNSLQILPL
jgi:hypothetical protein